MSSSHTQDYRFYNKDSDTITNCPNLDIMSQSAQVRLKQSGVSLGSNTCPCQNNERQQKGGDPTPLPQDWYNPECGCSNCQVRCPLRYGSDLMQDSLNRASCSQNLSGCGCPSNQSGGYPIGAPLYLTQPDYSNLFPREQTDKFPALKYNFTPKDGVKFVSINN